MRILIMGAISASFALAGVALAQSAPAPASEVACAGLPTVGDENAELLTRIMLEPRHFAGLADLMKTLPPDTMAKIAAMQKSALERQARDWPNLCRYAGENAQVLASGIRPRAVFLGDSITENWKLGDPALFSATVLDRGIGGQTTPQILLRFYSDVVALRPRVVHILAGVNDIMGNTGATSDATIVNNIRAMIDIAKANGIRVVLARITPAKTFAARPELNLVPRIAALNAELVQLAKEKRVSMIDYSSVLANSEGGFNAALSNDGLHPNRDGYAVMRPLAERAIARAAR